MGMFSDDFKNDPLGETLVRSWTSGLARDQISTLTCPVIPTHSPLR